jgi:hypothetical protein
MKIQDKTNIKYEKEIQKEELLRERAQRLTYDIDKLKEIIKYLSCELWIKEKELELIRNEWHK